MPLQSRMAFDRQRLPIEKQARKAQLNVTSRRRPGCGRTLSNSRTGRREDLALVCRRAARQYVDQVRVGQGGEGTPRNEPSWRNDIPFVHSLLTDIYMEEGAFQEFSRTISEATFVGPLAVVAVGKLVSFDTARDPCLERCASRERHTAIPRMRSQRMLGVADHAVNIIHQNHDDWSGVRSGLFASPGSNHHRR